MLRAAALLIAAALLSPCASALSACRAAVLDADTGEVCFARKASEHALIASTTKIMTGLLLAEDCDPDAVVTVPQEAVGCFRHGQRPFRWKSFSQSERFSCGAAALCCCAASTARFMSRTCAQTGS